MTDPIDPLADAVRSLRAAWVGAASGAGRDAAALRGMSDAALLEVNERIAALRRQLDGLHSRVAAEIAARSRPEAGRDGLARKAGHRSPAKLIAATTGAHPGHAARLIQVGEATRERTLLSGEAAPPRHPHLAAAVAVGGVSVAVAAAIAGMLDRIAVRVPAPVLNEAERVIVAQAASLSLDEVQAVLRRAEAHLDPDELEPVIDGLRAERSLKIVHDRAGMTVLTARLDPETAAPVVAAIEGIVTHQLRVSRGHNTPAGTAFVAGAGAEGAEGAEGGAVAEGGAGAEGAGASAEGGAGASAAGGAGEGGEAGSGVRNVPRPVADETRTLPQLRADALAAICRHAAGCDDTTLPRESTTVVVRIPLDALQTGTGLATIDGHEQPIDAGTARRMAASAEIIPCVLGGDSEILDLGRARRHFTRAQRLALVERDGGCAFCHLPPRFAEAHHILWWVRDHGPTDLGNAILLCTSCHHRVHDEGWEIRIESPPGKPPSAGTVWFVPPPHIDPARTPRLGGRRRFDPLAWGIAA